MSIALRIRTSNALPVTLCVPTTHEHPSLFRWLAPAAHEVAFHALVCLLRAAEVGLCGHSSTNRLQTALDMDTVGGGRAVVMEEGVPLLLLKACAKFQDHGDVVKICCMLMRVGVMCALHGEGFEVRMAR